MLINVGLVTEHTQTYSLVKLAQLVRVRCRETPLSLWVTEQYLQRGAIYVAIVKT